MNLKFLENVHWVNVAGIVTSRVCVAVKQLDNTRSRASVHMVAVDDGVGNKKDATLNVAKRSGDPTVTRHVVTAKAM